MNRRKRWLSRFLTVLVLIFVYPAAADAHMASIGMGDFINGLAHPLMTPAHVIIMLALGLGMAQRSPTDFKTPMFVFMPCCAAALLFTTTRIIPTVYPPILICIALGAGLLVVLEKPLPPWPCRALFAVAAIAIGLDSAPGAAPAATVAKNLCGTWLSLVVLTFDLGAYLSLQTKRHWVRVGIRILGSWITAISLMMLAFFLRK
jgi:hydrogenase/urease accessory protein HupE